MARHEYRVQPAFRRASVLLTLLWLAISFVISGCGRATTPSGPLTRTPAALERERVVVQDYAGTLIADVRRARLSPNPVATGLYRSCSARGGKAVSYVETVIVWASNPLTVTAMSQDISEILRSEGWTLVAVDFSKVHLAFGSTDHPLYDITQRGTWGTANILPFGGNSAGAMIFMHSPCINAGSQRS
jgi:hypothetical protein